MKKLTIIILFLLIIINYSEAQYYYCLKDCIATGLENNFSLQVAKNNQEISDNNLTLGNAGFLPYLNLGSRYNGTYNDIYQNMRDGTENNTKGVTTGSASASATLGMTIFNGFNIRTSYKKLEELKRIGELNTQLAIENYIANLVAGYFNYILQLKLAEISLLQISGNIMRYYQ